MDKKLKGTIRFGAVTSNREDSYVMLEIEDDASGMRFLEINMSYAQFGKAVGSNGEVDIEYTVRGVDKLGLKYEHKQGSAEMPAKVYKELSAARKDWNDREPYRQWLYENAKEDGWEISAYLGSQNSIVCTGSDNKPVTFNFTYYRYVDQVQDTSSS